MLVGKSGSSGAPPALCEPRLEHRSVVGMNGVRLALLPLPIVWMFAPVPSVMSWQFRATSSEIRSPVWIVSANIA